MPNAKPVRSPETTFSAARSNLLLVVVFTVVNVVLRLVSADMYFLFSASMPMACLDIAAFVESTTVTTVAAVIALFITALYLLCWIFSKKHRGWMVVALVLFALDTLLLFVVYEIEASMILDVAIHAWVLYYLITGTVAMVKLNKQPAEFTYPEIAPEQPAAYPGVPEQPVVYPTDPVAQPAEPVSAVPGSPAAPVMVNGQPLDEE